MAIIQNPETFNDFDAMRAELACIYWPHTVVHHSPCVDGLTAAWVWKERSKQRALPLNVEPYRWEAGNISAKYGNTVFVDMTPTVAEIERLLASGSKVWILDHHASALRVLDGLSDLCHDARRQGRLRIWLDQSMSGAMLAWRVVNGDKRPLPLVSYAQDRDLWRFELPGVDPFTYALHNAMGEGLAGLNRISAEPFEDVIRKWRPVVEYVNGKVKQALPRAERVLAYIGKDGAPVDVWAINATEWRSEIGHGLAVAFPFIALVWWREDGIIHCSLRSDGPNPANVAELAQNMGGGGHPRASGFKWRKPLEELFVVGGSDG